MERCAGGWCVLTGYLLIVSSFFLVFDKVVCDVQITAYWIMDTPLTNYFTGQSGEVSNAY